MILKRSNLFVIAVMSLPLASAKFPWFAVTKSFYAIIQIIISFIVIYSLLLQYKIKMIKGQAKIVISLALFFIILIISAWNSREITPFYSVYQYVKHLSFALLIGTYLVNKKSFNLKHVFFGFSISISLLAITCLTDQLQLTEFYKFSYDLEVRTVGLLGPPNKSGLLLAFAIGFNINYYLLKKPFYSFRILKNAAIFALTSVSIGALIISASRSGLILTIVFSLLLFFIFNRRRKLMLMSRFFTIVPCSIIIIFAVLPRGVIDYYRLRLLSSVAFISNPYTKEIMGASLTNRIYAITDSVNIAVEHPLFGVGPGNIKEKRLTMISDYPFFFTSPEREIHLDITAHNTFINIFAECGIPGGFIFIVLIGLLLRTFYYKWKRTGGYDYCVLFSFFCTYIIFLASQSVLWRNNLLFNLFVPLALSFSIEAAWKRKRRFSGWSSQKHFEKCSA